MYFKIFFSHMILHKWFEYVDLVLKKHRTLLSMLKTKKPLKNFIYCVYMYGIIKNTMTILEIKILSNLISP